MKTNTKVQTKVTSLQSPVSSLLQRPCAGDNHPIAAMSDVPPVTCLRSGFAHDFSAIPAHPEAPGRLQTKLTVSTPSDMYEQEADAMADTVMRMPENQSSLLRRNQSRAKPSSEHMAPTVRPKNEVGAAVSNTLSKKIISSQGAGSGMESNTQSAMQNRFGADFSRVKIHTDGEAVQISRELGAQAFTVGRDIYFD